MNTVMPVVLEVDAASALFFPPYSPRVRFCLACLFSEIFTWCACLS